METSGTAIWAATAWRLAVGGWNVALVGRRVEGGQVLDIA